MTISSALSLLFVGVLLVAFVIAAPKGIVGGSVDDRALLTVAGLGKRFGGFVALADIDLEVAEGERLALIGPNGSGKSTLVNCLCGTLRNDRGVVTFGGQQLNGLSAHQRTRLGMARSFQLAAAVSDADPGGEHPRADPLCRRREGRAASLLDPRRRCEELLEMVGLLAKADRRPADLTQIEMRKLELARAMASEPRLLIADEAMAGLSHQEVDDILALLMRLNAQGVTIIMIEHIMRAVLAFSQRLVVLVAGRQDLRRGSARGHSSTRCRGGLSWQLVFRLLGSKPVMAPCASCTTSRCRSPKAKRLPCWGPTATANPR